MNFIKKEKKRHNLRRCKRRGQSHYGRSVSPRSAYDCGL